MPKPLASSNRRLHAVLRRLSRRATVQKTLRIARTGFTRSAICNVFGGAKLRCYAGVLSDNPWYRKLADYERSSTKQ